MAAPTATSAPAPTVMTPQNLESFAGLKVTKPHERATRGNVYVIYGQGGVGKTALAAQIVDSEFVKRGVVWLDIDAGTDTIDHLIKEGKIQQVQIESWNQLDKFTQAYIREQPWDVVCIDNMSEGQTLDLRGITGSDRQPEIQEYGTSEAHMLSVVRRWRDIAEQNDIIVFILFWETTKDKGGGKKDDLQVTNKLAEKLAGIVGWVLHLTSEPDRDVTRKISIAGASTKTAAKSRRDITDKVAWSIPNEIYYRVDQTPLVDMLRAIRNGVTFPASKYQRKADTSSTAGSN